jgi:hypothetical protein
MPVCPLIRKNNAALVAAYCDGAGHRHLCARVPGARRPAIWVRAVSHCSINIIHSPLRGTNSRADPRRPPREAKPAGHSQRPRDTTARRPYL